MSHEERIKEIIETSLERHERMFPILNKIDKIWMANPTLQFCELVKLIVLDSKNDLEFTQKLDEYIDEHNLK
jgi:hypothetical protein